MQIPPDRLSNEALQGLLEEYISREGTDYGPREFSLEDKKRHVLGQIDRGKVVIAFDDESQSCNLLTIDQYQEQQQLLGKLREQASQEDFQQDG